MTNRPLELIKGTLDVLILKTLADGPLHGYGVSRSIRERTSRSCSVSPEEAALSGRIYPTKESRPAWKRPSD